MKTEKQQAISDICKYKKIHKLSTEALALKLNINYTTLYRIIRGKTKYPHDTTCEKIKEFIKEENKKA